MRSIAFIWPAHAVPDGLDDLPAPEWRYLLALSRTGPAAAGRTRPGRVARRVEDRGLCERSVHGGRVVMRISAAGQRLVEALQGSTARHPSGSWRSP